MIVFLFIHLQRLLMRRMKPLMNVNSKRYMLARLQRPSFLLLEQQQNRHGSPMNIGDTGNIYVERGHPAYRHVMDFLVSCCEPVSRTHHMEQYRMDSASLSAATAEGTYSLAMIECVLRHFRLNSQHQLPVDLEQCTALETLAAALDECNWDMDDADLHAEKETEPSHARSAAVAALAPLPGCLAACDFRETVLASVYGGAQHRFHASSSASPDASSAAPPAVRIKTEPVRDGDAAISADILDGASLPAAAPPAFSPVPSQGRVLRLFRPSSPADPMPPPSPPPAAAAPTVPSSAKPLITLAVVRPHDVRLSLPDTITRMLMEEEQASRVQIVLQPRLRRFHQFDTSRTVASSAQRTRGEGSREGQGAAGGSREEGQLFYFIESRQRGHLELVLEALKEYLEPVLLYGKERWILSDVDRSPAFSLNPASSTGAGSGNLRDAERVVRDGGRPAVLRMLYEAPGGDGKRSSSFSSAPARTVSMARPASAAASRFVYKCQIKEGHLKEVKERLFSQFNIRADCYYDYRQDETLHVPRLSLASHVRLRPYQVASLERFRRGDKAHQGVVVLPCGAGKTLTGIGAAAAMQKTTIVMCVNNMSVFQWQREFLRWTDLRPDEVTVCTAKVKQMPGKVFITTYSMVIAKRGKSDGAAAEESRAILKAMTSQPWGLLLLDEVHTALAHHFQNVLNTIKYKCVLGLSATLLREDDKIGDLRHLVGPKLYEANWLDLTRAGFLANVECAEVQCPMPLLFLKEYREVQRARLLLGSGRADGQRWQRQQRQRQSVFETSDTEDAGEKTKYGSSGGRVHWGGLHARAIHLASCNPYKLWCTQALLAFHQQRSPPDKVIIFCDYLADVRFFAHHLHLPFMDQRTSEAERTNLLQYFQHSGEVNAIILTRVGDVALDLPCASVIIQVSGLGASRRQEAQRLGRILRPKPPSLDNTCAYFYTLVSQDTADIRTSYKRQSWLRDQGFAYRILHSDAVLDEFRRVGGQPCCVGVPQWWYQVPANATLPLEQRRQSASQHAAVWDDEDELSWAPFSDAAALRIEKAFQQGRDTCQLNGSELGAETPRPSPAELGHYPLRLSESWTITFSSADAPQTFGTVVIGEGGGGAPGSVSSGGGSPRVRRVRRGCLDHRHRCATADPNDRCLAYALGMVAGVRTGDGGSTAEHLDGDDGVDLDEAEFEDDV